MHLKMKRLTLSILAILAFTTAAAQEPATKRHGYRDSEGWMLRGKVKRIAEENFYASKTSASGKVVFDTTSFLIFDFNRAGDVVREQYLYSSDPSSNQNGVIYYTYDQRGNCIERYHPTGKTRFVVPVRTVCKYDERGLPAEGYEVYSDSSVHNYVAYKHNRKGQKIREYGGTFNLGHRAAVESYPQIRYKYDAAGNCVKKIIYNGEGKVDEKTKMRYDKQNRLVNERRNSHRKDMKLRHLRRTKAVIFDYTPHQRNSYRYDERGNCIEQISYFPVEDIRATTTYKFDQMDNCIEERFRQERSDSLLRKFLVQTRYEYDTQGNWIKRTKFSEYKGEFRPTFIILREISYYE